jgi:hypothetical protein
MRIEATSPSFYFANSYLRIRETEPRSEIYVPNNQMREEGW